MTEMVWAVLRQNDRLLLVRQSLTDYSEGIWTLPGGKIDHKDVNAVTTIHRELKEKLGLEGKRFRELIHTQIDKYNIQIFFCDKWQGEPKPACENMIEVRWFTWTEIYTLDQNLAPFISNTLLYLSYLMQHYDHHPNEWKKQWEEVK